MLSMDGTLFSLREGSLQALGTHVGPRVVTAFGEPGPDLNRRAVAHGGLPAPLLSLQARERMWSDAFQAEHLLCI